MPKKPPSPPPASLRETRPLAPHVQAACGAVQARLPLAPKPKSHVQAAITAAAQPRFAHPARGSGQPNPRNPPLQAKAAAAPHVQASSFFHHQPLRATPVARRPQVAQLANNPDISYGKVEIRVGSSKKLTLTSLLTRRELEEEGEFSEPQIVDLTRSTKRPSLSAMDLSDQSLFLSPELKTIESRSAAPLLDDWSSNMTATQSREERTKMMRRALEAKALLEEEYQSILIHCNNGRTRTPAVAAIVVALLKRVSFRAALAEVFKEYREQRSGLPQILGVDLSQDTGVETFMASGKLVDLAEQVYNYLAQARGELERIETTPAWEPVAMRTRSHLDLSMKTLRQILDGI